MARTPEASPPVFVVVIRTPPALVIAPVIERPAVESAISRSYWVAPTSPTLEMPRLSNLLPELVRTTEPPMPLVAEPRVSALALMVVVLACEIFPVIRPIVAVSSPMMSVPLGTMMLGSVKLLVPRIVTALVVLLSVFTVPLRVIVPDSVPS